MITIGFTILGFILGVIVTAYIKTEIDQDDCC